MIFITELPNIKMSKQKLKLPHEQKSPSMYNMVFVNNNSTEATINLINNPHLFHDNKYHMYYMDNMYHGSLFKRSYRQFLTQEREDIYQEIKTKLRFITPERAFDELNKRNVYFDLQYYNKIFYDYAKRTPIFKKKVTTYLSYLKSIVNDDRFAGYHTKMVMIDLNSWENANLKSELTNVRQHDTPLFMIYFAMFKLFDTFKSLGNINFFFYAGNGLIRVNPQECDKNSYRKFRIELMNLSKEIHIADDAEIEQSFGKEETYSKIINSFAVHYNFTGESDEEEADVEHSLRDRLDEISEQDEVKNLKGKELEDKLTTEIINDETTLKKVFEITQDNRTGRSTASIKRDEELRQKQKEIKLDGISIDKLREIVSDDVKLEVNDISTNVKTTNRNVTKVRYPHFEKAYNRHLYKKDLLNILTDLNDKSVPVFIRNIEIEDTSDELNYKETYKVTLEDSNRVRHTLKFDMPKFIDDKFMYLNGNKKLIIKQLFMKPVVKTKPDEVQVCSNYNKIFIHRYGTKISDTVERFKKAVALMDDGKKIKVKYGNNLKSNMPFKTTIEYDELSKNYTSIEAGNAIFMFNQEEVQKLCKERKVSINNDEYCIGFFIKDKSPIIFRSDDQEDNHSSIIDFILSIEQGQVVEAYKEASSGKKFVYTRATIMRKRVPLIMLLGFVEGLSTVMRKAGIKYRFSDTRPKDLDINREGIIKFEDGYLIYDKYPFQNCLLMNAFGDIPTKGFKYEEFDQKDVYLTLFDVMFGTKIIGNAFFNFYEFMIDPITREVLEDLNYPTDFVSLLLFANSLLADNSFIKENNMNLYRIRSNELVNAFLYKEISNAYIRYRLTANNNNPVKISVPQDIVLKRILTAQTVEDYSILNPIVELEKSRAITPKGHSGLNVDEAYTQDKRAYDKTMLGLLAMSTSPDANCGIVRQLTMEPNILGPRGYIDIKDDKLHELFDAHLFSPAELLSPLGVTRDDSIRTAMATKQSKHIIPIDKSAPVLISNGSEQAIHYHLSDDFSVDAKYNGKVVELDEAAGIMVVQYTDPKGILHEDGGTTTSIYKAIDISPRVVKNGAGGFFLSNQLQPHFKQGQTFKKNDILASDKKFFSNSRLDGIRFNIGSIQKVACMSSYSTYEDSTFITKKLSEDMAADIIMQRPVVLGKNATIDYVVKPGDTVQVGDDLLRFELSFEEDSLNKFLSSIGEELKEEIKSLGKTPIKSKYSGVIEDIKVYSTVDIEELSPSLQKLVKSYHDRINKKKRIVEKYDKSKSSMKAGILFTEPTSKVETKDGKVKGTEVGEGVLIEIYIKYRDVMGVGDKLTFFTALKSIIGEVIEEGYEPYSEFRPEEEVSSFIAPGAVLARMTPSILQTMFGYKVLIELKRSLQEIYTGKPWEPKK